MDDYLEILNRFDEGVEHLEHPADLSILDELPEDIRVLQETLGKFLGLDFKMSIDRDPYRAWFGGLHILHDVNGNPCPDYERGTRARAALIVRISNFGRLTTIFGCTEEIQAQFPVGEIAQHLLEANFNYIPIEVLLTPYSGSIAAQNRLREGYTWFDRFFFYPS